MKLYYDWVYTAPFLCSLILLTVWNIENSGSYMPAFFWAHIVIIKSIKVIVVPVRPIPAEQWTIAFSSDSDFRFQSINLLSIISKSSTAYPSGTPWSGHPEKCI